MINPFKAVGLEVHEALQLELARAEQERDDSRREASGLRIELRREQENAERLTALCGRAVKTAEILEQTLIERQIGKQRDPSLVLVVGNLAAAPKRRHGFVPLNKRRREAAKREEAAEVRRNALPKLSADLPSVPLTREDREAMRETVAELIKETA